MSEGLRIGTHQYLDSIEFNKNYAAGLIPERNAVPFIRYKNSVVSSRPQTGIGGSPTITAAVVTTNITPIKGYQTWLFTKNAGDAQGEGWSVPFSVDLSGRAKVMKIEFDYMVASGTFNAGSKTVDSDLIVYIYDIDAAQLIEPSSFKLFSNSTTLTDKFSGYFQTSATSTNYRLIFHVASTNASAWALEVDNISISQSQYVYGTPITDWVAYTPTFNSGFTVGTGSNARNEWFWRRVGDKMEISGAFRLGSAGSSMGSGNFTFTLPSGFNADRAKMPQGDGFAYVGTGRLGDYSANAGYGEATVAFSSTSTTNTFFIPANNGSFGVVNGTTPYIWTVDDFGSVLFSVPIQGWSSSVRMSDGFEARDVVASLNCTFGSGAISIPNNTDTKVPLNIAAIDTVSAHDSANNRYIVRTSGFYRIKAFVTFDVVSTGWYRAIIRLNGTTDLAFGWQNVFVGTSNYNSVNAERVVRLNAGDFIELFTMHVSGAARNVRTESNMTFMDIERLASPQTTAQGEALSAIYAAPSGGVGQSIPNATDTIINFSVLEFDSHGSVTTGVSWRFTAQSAGTYEVSSFVQLAGGGGWGAGEEAYITLFKNGSGLARIGINIAQTTHTQSVNVTCAPRQVRLNAGDYIDLRIGQNSGAAIALVNAGSLNWVSIKKVG
jgi:hypothetical protein